MRGTTEEEEEVEKAKDVGVFLIKYCKGHYCWRCSLSWPYNGRDGLKDKVKCYENSHVLNEL